MTVSAKVDANQCTLISDIVRSDGWLEAQVGENYETRQAVALFSRRRLQVGLHLSFSLYSSLLLFLWPLYQPGTPAQRGLPLTR